MPSSKTTFLFLFLAFGVFFQFVIRTLFPYDTISNIEIKPGDTKKYMIIAMCYFFASLGILLFLIQHYLVPH